MPPIVSVAYDLLLDVATRLEAIASISSSVSQPCLICLDSISEDPHRCLLSLLWRLEVQRGQAQLYIVGNVIRTSVQMKKECKEIVKFSEYKQS